MRKSGWPNSTGCAVLRRGSRRPCPRPRPRSRSSASSLRRCRAPGPSSPPRPRRRTAAGPARASGRTCPRTGEVTSVARLLRRGCRRAAAVAGRGRCDAGGAGAGRVTRRAPRSTAAGGDGGRTTVSAAWPRRMKSCSSPLRPDEPRHVRGLEDLDDLPQRLDVERRAARCSGTKRRTAAPGRSTCASLPCASLVGHGSSGASRRGDARQVLAVARVDLEHVALVDEERAR